MTTTGIPRNRRICSWRQGDQLVCEFGDVGEPSTFWHYTRNAKWYLPDRNLEPSDVCIHTVDPAPHVMLFGTDHARSIGIEEKMDLSRHWPCWISRRDDIITIRVDHIGEPFDPAQPACIKPGGTWRYRLHPITWSDTVIGDENGDTILLGVWPD
jgi:hypothetical protein